jgi:hypothetical protein
VRDLATPTKLVPVPCGATLSSNLGRLRLPPKAARTAGPPEGAAAPLPQVKAFGSFAVDDLAAARKFYGETLDVRVSDEDGPSCSTSPVTNAA